MASGRSLGLLPNPVVCGEGRLGPAEGEGTTFCAERWLPGRHQRPGPEWVCVYISSGPSHPPASADGTSTGLVFPRTVPLYSREEERREKTQPL